MQAYCRDMTMNPAEIERKERRLDNDVQGIYELLVTISFTQTRHGRRFDEVDARFDAMDQRFDGVDRRFDGMDQRFDAMDQRFDGLDQRFDEVLTLLRGPADR